LPSTPGAPAVVPSAEFFCTAVLGVVWVPAAGPEVSPCAGSGAAIEADALNSTIANAATEKAKVEHVDFIDLPPLFLVPLQRRFAAAVCSEQVSTCHHGDRDKANAPRPTPPRSRRQGAAGGTIRRQDFARSGEDLMRRLIAHGARLAGPPAKDKPNNWFGVIMADRE
jgi:hypothetical protein